MNTAPIRVLFACRGSTRDGLGHVMRSRSVAMEMARHSRVRMVIVGDRYVDALLANRGLDYTVVEGEPALVAHYRKFDPQVVVFDGLKFARTSLAAMREQVVTVSLSPIFNLLNEMDIVFHRTVQIGDSWNQTPGEGPEIRAGLQYSVIREQCVAIDQGHYRASLEQQPLSIVVSMGGADAENKTLATLRAIQSVQRPLLIWTLLGEGYGHSYEDLVECVRQNQQHEIILAKTSDSMWRVMQTCSLAILAGGTITYEAAYAGLPSINIFEDAHHVFLIRELVEKGICVSAGYPLFNALGVVVEQLAHLESHRDELWRMHQQAQGQVDAHGARRIATEIIDFYERELPRCADIRG